MGLFAEGPPELFGIALVAAGLIVIYLIIRFFYLLIKKYL